MRPYAYYSVMRQSQDPRFLRLQMALYAKAHGVKPAARAFKVTPKTIRKWLAPDDLLSYVEAILRVYNMQGRRDNIHKARIKIIVNQMGIDKYRELVDKEWELTKNGALKLPDG